MPPSLRPGLVLLAVAAAFAIGAATASATTYSDPNFGERTLANGFGSASIVNVTWAPDGRMFVADRAGVVWVHNPGAPPGDNQVVLNISDHVNNADGTDHGLLGIATDADFATNGFLYLLYTYDASDTDDSGRKVSVLTRVVVHPDNSVDGGVDNPAETMILGTKQAAETGSDGACGAPANDNDCIPSEGASHSIATVRSDADGTLWVSTGDGSDYNIVDPLAGNDGNPATYRGKIMHIARDGHGLPSNPYCPANPVTDVCSKIFASGLRNPFRFSLLPGGGLAVGDVGQNSWEEIDLAHGGENFGWPCFEGDGPDTFTAGGKTYPDDLPYCQTLSESDVTAPALAISHDSPGCDPSTPTGNTVVGGPVYEGDRYPVAYRGQLFFGDVGGGPFFDESCGWVGRATIGDNSLTNYHPFATDWGSEGVDIESAPNGNLVYVAMNDSAVREIVYGPDHSPTVAPTATPSSGSAPLTVSLDAHAVDQDRDELLYGWDFGDGSPHSTTPSPTHVYATPGNWVATVTVNDGRGGTAGGSVSIPVHVGGGGGGGSGGSGGQTPPPLKITKFRLTIGISALLRHGVLRGSFTSASSVKSLNVGLWRGKPGAAASCRWWSRRSHKLRSGSCSQPHWMKATLHRKGSRYTWTLNLRGTPPKGKYTLVLQANPRSTKLAPSVKMRKTLRVR